MGLKIRGRQDGTGPYRLSFQREKFLVGKRKQAGYDCPFETIKQNRFRL